MTQIQRMQGVFSKLSRSDLITLYQDLMDICQEKAIHIKIIKKQYVLIKDELSFSKDKIEKLERDQITLVKDMFDKPLN